MKLHAICPGCGKRSSVDPSRVGKALRCKGCDRVFRFSGSSSEPTSERRQQAPPQGQGQGGGRSPSHVGIEADDDLDASIDASWLDDGADGEPAAAARPSIPGRSRSSEGEGPSWNLLIGLGIGTAALVIVLVVLAAFPMGRGPKPRTGDDPIAADEPAAPGLFDRVANAVSGSTADSSRDVSAYPNLGPLLPQLLPPPPLRDLSGHERMDRAIISSVDRLGGILASVHDVPSMKSAGEQIQRLGDQMVADAQKNTLPFRATPAEEAELTRRSAGEMRRVMDRMRDESRRISALPGLGLAGAELSSLVERLAIPVEVAMRRAENFRPPSAPPPYADVYIHLRDGADTVVFRQQLDELLADEREKGIQSVGPARDQKGVSRTSFRVWPVFDVDSFARKISHGEVAVEGRRIFVNAGPISATDLASAQEAQKRKEEAQEAVFKAARAGSPDEANDPKPPADADELTKALFALRSSRSGKRMEGATQIGRMTPVDARREEVHKQLVALLSDADGFLVNTVMKAMVRWRTEETVKALIPMLERPDFGVRWEAAEVLGNLGDPQAAAPLAAHLKEDGIKVGPALRALGAAAEPALLPLLRDPDPQVRAESCRILKDVGGKEALQTMMTLPADPDLGVQMAARAAMQDIRGRVGPIAVPRKPSSATGRGKAG